jgi:hypothetical protein
MRLVEVAGVACDSRHPILDVFQHQVVLWFCYNQSGVHIAKDQFIAQRVLLFVGDFYCTPPLEFDVPPNPRLAVVKSPKAVAFPVDAIVTYEITFV